MGILKFFPHEGILTSSFDSGAVGGARCAAGPGARTEMKLAGSCKGPDRSRARVLTSRYTEWSKAAPRRTNSAIRRFRPSPAELTFLCGGQATAKDLPPSDKLFEPAQVPEPLAQGGPKFRAEDAELRWVKTGAFALKAQQTCDMMLLWYANFRSDGSDRDAIWMSRLLLSILKAERCSTLWWSLRVRV
jgi:hypothetical protein